MMGNATLQEHVPGLLRHSFAPGHTAVAGAGKQDGHGPDSFNTWGTTAQSRAYEIENMIMFLPVGVFLPLTHRRLRRFRMVTLVLTGLSIGIELIQFVTQRGYLQTDDVIMNVLGGVAGYGVWRWICERRKK